MDDIEPPCIGPRDGGWLRDVRLGLGVTLVRAAESAGISVVEWGRRERGLAEFDRTEAIDRLVASSAAKTRVQLEQAERERDELLRGLANIESDLGGIEDDFAAMGIAGRAARAAASMMVTAIRLHPNIETGITVSVNVDGRILDVIGQWSDAPIVTNWVAWAADVMRGTKSLEAELAELRSENASVRDARGKVDIDQSDGGLVKITNAWVCEDCDGIYFMANAVETVLCKACCDAANDQAELDDLLEDS